MTEQDEKKELIKGIKSLEKKIVKLEKESRIGLEDQLFFALVVSIAIFVVTLPLNELASFFQNTINLNYADAVQASETVKNMSIMFLFSSTILRYYGAVKPHKGARLLSFLCLILAMDFFLLMLVVNVIRGFAIEVLPFSLPFSLLALGFIYLMIGEFVERRIIKFYAKRGLILKKYTRLPIASPLFAVLSLSLYFMLSVQMVSAILFGVFLNQLQLHIIYSLIFCVFSFLYILRLRRERLVRFWKKK